MNRWIDTLRIRLFGSLRQQLIWSVALVHAVMMTLFVYDLTQRQHDFLLHNQTDVAQHLAQALALTATPTLLSGDLAELQELTQAGGQYPGVVFVMVLNQQGKILAHKESDKRGLFVTDLPGMNQCDGAPMRLLTRNLTLVDLGMVCKTRPQCVDLEG